MNVGTLLPLAALAAWAFFLVLVLPALQRRWARRQPPLEYDSWSRPVDMPVETPEQTAARRAMEAELRQRIAALRSELRRLALPDPPLGVQLLLPDRRGRPAEDTKDADRLLRELGFSTEAWDGE